MLAQLATLFRYRLLIQSLVGRELKARYRGSILGFFWSFVNPLLLLLTYWLVFTYMLPGVRATSVEPYFLFLFCGILPWTWFQSSVAESSGVLIAGGNLIKKVLFPAEVLPVVTVARQHGALPLRTAHPAAVPALERTSLRHALCFSPCPCWCSSVHRRPSPLRLRAHRALPRHLQNILGHLLHIWFFATPVLYAMPETGRMRSVLRCNPMAHVLVSYQQMLFYGTLRPWPRTRAGGRRRGGGLRAGRLPVRPAARHAGGGSVSTPAVVARDLAKVYRRFLHKNQFRR